MSKGNASAAGPVVLIVLDGWGFRREREGNAIALGDTPTWDGLAAACPMTLLEASGGAVGLPQGQMGNSEVGHLNLGAGRVVDQDIVRISESMDTRRFQDIPEIAALCGGTRERNGTLHVLGLMGGGGVHATHYHLEGILRAAVHHRVARVAIHAFLDGRDTPPHSGADFMRAVVRAAAESTAAGTDTVVASATGRYYAMDRDNRWNRIQLAYDAMVNGVGHPVDDPVQGILDAYDRGETDEFVTPMVVTSNGSPPAVIRDGDGIFCMNFRADRMRQIVRALAIDGFDGFKTGVRPSLDVVTMTQYDATFPLKAAFPPRSLSRMVGEVIADAGLTQLRTAETEKYAHVTYFFNCGVEVPFKGEERRLVPSQQVATYDLMPIMSAPGITDGLCGAIEARSHDFMLCNYANGDMVGHSGVLEATVRAVEAVDASLTRIFKSAERAGATVMVTADHGNCEMMIDPRTGGPHTAHTTNLVPLVLYGDIATRSLRATARLSDVGPTILNLLGVEIPSEMTGVDLREGIT